MGEFRVSEETKRKISEAIRRNYQSPAYRERQKRRTREAMRDPELRKRMGQARRATWVRQKATAKEATP